MSIRDDAAQFALPRLGLLLLVVLLAGCYQVELRGPVADATLDIAPYRDAAQRTNLPGKTTGVAAARQIHGVAEYNGWPDIFQLASLGVLDIEVNADKPEHIFLIRAQGGVDLDPDRDYTVNGSGAPVSGQVHAIVNGAEAEMSGITVSALTEAVYQTLRHDAFAYSDGQVQDKLDQLAKVIVADTNGDGAVNSTDLLFYGQKFGPGNYKGDIARLRGFADQVRRGYPGMSEADIAKAAARVLRPAEAQLDIREIQKRNNDSTATAQDMGAIGTNSVITLSGKLGGGNRQDWYSFTATSPMNVRRTGGNKVDVTVYAGVREASGNTRINAGETVFVLVAQKYRGSSNYRIQLAITGAGVPKGDFDGDGIANSIDLCPAIADGDNTDRNGNGLGDACDRSAPRVATPTAPGCPAIRYPDLSYPGCDASRYDRDLDSIANDVDNCPDTANGDQRDMDGDRRGDACDATDDRPKLLPEPSAPTGGGGSGGDGQPSPQPDGDGDGVPDGRDNCPSVANPEQRNAANSGTAAGDACEPLGNLRKESGSTLVNGTRSAFETKDRGIRPRGYQLKDLDLQIHPSGIAYSALWEKSDQHSQWLVTYDLDEFESMDVLLQNTGYALTDIEVLRDAKRTLYAGVWRASSEPSIKLLNLAAENFPREDQSLMNAGWYMADIEVMQVNGKWRVSAIYRPGRRQYRSFVSASWEELTDLHGRYQAEGFEIYDLDTKIVDNTGSELFAAVWHQAKTPDMGNFSAPVFSFSSLMQTASYLEDNLSMQPWDLEVRYGLETPQYSMVSVPDHRTIALMGSSERMSPDDLARELARQGLRLSTGASADGRVEDGECEIFRTNANADDISADFGVLTCSQQSADGSQAVRTLYVHGGCDVYRRGVGSSCSVGLLQTEAQLEIADGYFYDAGLSGPKLQECTAISAENTCFNGEANFASAEATFRDENGNSATIGTSIGVGTRFSGGLKDGVFTAGAGFGAGIGLSFEVSINLNDAIPSPKHIYRATEDGYFGFNDVIVGAGYALPFVGKYLLDETDIVAWVEDGETILFGVFEDIGQAFEDFFSDIAGFFEDLFTAIAG